MGGVRQRARAHGVPEGLDHGLVTREAGHSRAHENHDGVRCRCPSSWAAGDRGARAPASNGRSLRAGRRALALGRRRRAVQGLVPLGGVIPVMSEQAACSAVPSPRVDSRWRATRAWSSRRCVAEQARLGGFLRQRMLEDVLALGQRTSTRGSARRGAGGQRAVQLGRLIVSARSVRYSKNRPITAACWRSALAGAGRRSMRAAMTPRSVVGMVHRSGRGGRPAIAFASGARLPRSAPG